MFVIDIMTRKVNARMICDSTNNLDSVQTTLCAIFSRVFFLFAFPIGTSSSTFTISSIFLFSLLSSIFFFYTHMITHTTISIEICFLLRSNDLHCCYCFSCSSSVRFVLSLSPSLCFILTVGFAENNSAFALTPITHSLLLTTLSLQTIDRPINNEYCQCLRPIYSNSKRRIEVQQKNGLAACSHITHI
jgi:hypothetical protein